MNKCMKKGTCVIPWSLIQSNHLGVVVWNHHFTFQWRNHFIIILLSSIPNSSRQLHVFVWELFFLSSCHSLENTLIKMHIYSCVRTPTCSFSIYKPMRNHIFLHLFLFRFDMVYPNELCGYGVSFLPAKLEGCMGAAGKCSIFDKERRVT